MHAHLNVGVVVSVNAPLNVPLVNQCVDWSDMSLFCNCFI